MSTDTAIPVPHPGEVLHEDFLAPAGITEYRLALDIGVAPRRINEIIRGRRRISADIALRLARYFATTETFFANLQEHYDLEVEKDRISEALEQITPRCPVQ